MNLRALIAFSLICSFHVYAQVDEEKEDRENIAKEFDRLQASEERRISAVKTSEDDQEETDAPAVERSLASVGEKASVGAKNNSKKYQKNNSDH